MQGRRAACAQRMARRHLTPASPTLALAGLHLRAALDRPNNFRFSPQQQNGLSDTLLHRLSTYWTFRCAVTLPHEKRYTASISDSGENQRCNAPADRAQPLELNQPLARKSGYAGGGTSIPARTNAMGEQRYSLGIKVSAELRAGAGKWPGEPHQACTLIMKTVARYIPHPALSALANCRLGVL